MGTERGELAIADDFGRSEQPPEPPEWLDENPGEAPRTEEDGPADAELLARIRYAEQVSEKTRQLQIIDDARRRLNRERRAAQPKPDPVRLDQFLARHYEDPTYRIDRCWPTGGRVLLAARKKAGKSTLLGNLLRALVDGTPFLDQFTVTRQARVVLIDNELDERTIHRWLTAQGITNTEAIQLIALRGRVATFDILDDDTRAEWAKDIAGADVVILDCLRPVLDALGLDENREAGRFLVPFDALLHEAGATEAVITHHMGHGSERSRGDSRLQDWPDALWNLVIDKDEDDDQLDDHTGARYFSAFGRDVDVRQGELTYDPATRRLTFNDLALDRRKATDLRKTVKAEDAVLKVVAALPGIGKTDLRAACGAHGVRHNPHIDTAVQNLVSVGLIRREVKGRSHLHYPGEKTLD